ncbi:MAG: iron-containing alcohol dehydrogenase [Clostridiales bacterium]|jgi:alcohol dehydrogenase YqhD (iron-dependent ADH family)|nr:iron-containing alcohol dehydrogenase [Clostridiales bacterium]
MNSFVYQNTTKVYFGQNQLNNLGSELSKYGKRVLLTYGGGSIKKTGLYDKIKQEIDKSNLQCFEFGGIEPNPRTTSVEEAAEICKKQKIDVLLAVGGGSVLDCTKFIGAATFYDGNPWDIVLGKAKVDKGLPLLTVLTLTATGSEMNSGGVITNLETKDKIGNRLPFMQPKASFLDPTNTYSVDAYQTACGAADILSHVIEVYFCKKQDLFLLDCIMESLMRTVVKYAPIAIKEPTNYEARANLMWAGSWAINGLINGGKQQGWSCHPMEHQLSAYYDISHGLGLAILTPRWMEYCLDSTTVDRFNQFATNVFGITVDLSKMEIARIGIQCLSDFLFKTCGLNSTLTSIDIDSKFFVEMAKKAANGTKNSYKALTEQDIEKIYKMCL